MIVKKTEIPGEIQTNLDIDNLSKSSVNYEKKANVFHSYIKEEAGESVYNYFNELGVFQSSEVLILSSKHSFSYDEEYMKNIKTIFNLKPLNHIPKINLLFFELNRILPNEGYYIGCYEDMYTAQKKMAEKYPNYLVKIWFSLFYSLPQLIFSLPVVDIIAFSIGLSTKKCLTIQNVQKIMQRNGFKVVNTKQFNEENYFIAKKIKKVKMPRFAIINFFEKIINKNLVITI